MIFTGYGIWSGIGDIFKILTDMVHCALITDNLEFSGTTKHMCDNFGEYVQIEISRRIFN